MKPLALTTEGFTESVIREMTRICDASGGYNLAQGFPDFPSPEPVVEAAIQAIRDGHNQYPVTFGEPGLRDAISRKVAWYNGIECDPETEVTVTCGATEAMIATLKALINPGDEVIVFEPFYENYGPDAILSGAQPRYVSLRLEKCEEPTPDWSFDPDDLVQAFNDRTKAIIVNTPNNPTGKVFSRQELGVIAALCQRWDCYAITDEVYEHILYDGVQHISLASLPGMAERTVTINSVSKSYSVTGWRVGWAIAHPSITRSIRKVHDFLTVGAPTPFQHAAVVGLELPPSYYDALADRYLRARDFLVDALRCAGFRPSVPHGAYYVLAEATHLMARWDTQDDHAFARRLLTSAGVAAVPGSSFYSGGQPNPGRTQVRFCFCKQWGTLEAVGKSLAGLR
jgi:aspartate/methionine/tyrosine aminotransferase